MQDAVCSLLRRQGQFGYAVRPGTGTAFEVIEKLGAYVFPDIMLRLLRAASDMRGKQYVAQALQGREKRIAVLFGLCRKYVDRGAADMPVGDGFAQGFQVHHLAPCIIDENASLAEIFQRCFVDQVLRALQFGYMEGNDIGVGQYFLQTLF